MFWSLMRGCYCFYTLGCSTGLYTSKHIMGGRKCLFFANLNHLVWLNNVMTGFEHMLYNVFLGDIQQCIFGGTQVFLQ